MRAGGQLDTGTLRSGVAVGGHRAGGYRGRCRHVARIRRSPGTIFRSRAAVSTLRRDRERDRQRPHRARHEWRPEHRERQAGGTITLVKEGSAGTLSAGTLIAGTGASLTSSTGIDPTMSRAPSGDVDFDAVLRRDPRNGDGAERERQHPRRRSRHPRRHHRRAGLDHQPQRRKCGDGAWRCLGAPAPSRSPKRS